jgi:hypothetical protein
MLFKTGLVDTELKRAEAEKRARREVASSSGREALLIAAPVATANAIARVLD